MTSMDPEYTDPDEIVKSGWLIREVPVEGSMSTWKKQWNTLSLHELRNYKSDKSSNPISKISVASIEEMCYGTIHKLKSFAFELRTAKDKYLLAAESEQEREDWLRVLRELVPRAKLAVAKEMLSVKTQHAATLQLTKQLIKEAIESILRDSKKCEVRPGFKEYSDGLAMTLQHFLGALDSVGDQAHNAAKDTMFAVSAIVDAANSVAAVSTNKRTQNVIVMLTRDIAVETAQEVLKHLQEAGTDPEEKRLMDEGITGVREMVAELLNELRNAAQLEKQLDTAKRAIERTLDEPMPLDRSRLDTPLESNVDSIGETARLMSANIKAIQNNVLAQPERVGQYSKQAAELMCEMLEASSIVAYQSGLDPETLDVLANAGDISAYNKMQLESMLAAAKGFAAATTNMIDLLREIPGQTDDESVQLRLAETTRTADTALNAFMLSTANIDTTPLDQRASRAAGYDDSELEAELAASAAAELDAELQYSLSNVEGSIDQLNGSINSARASRSTATGPNGEPLSAEELAALESLDSILAAASNMGGASADLLRAVVEAQRDLVTNGQFAEIARRDPNWAKVLGQTARAVAENTQQLMDVASDPNSTAEEIVAAARCFNGACNRLVQVSHEHGDPSSQSYKNVDVAAKAATQATNQLINLAKGLNQQKQNNAPDMVPGGLSDADLEQLRFDTRNAQMLAEYEAQREIARLEAECEKARDYLGRVRKVITESPASAPESLVEAPKSNFTSAPTNAAPRGRGGASAGAGAGAGAARTTIAPRGGAASRGAAAASAGGAVRGSGAPRGGAAGGGAPRGGVAPRGGAGAAGAPRGGAAPPGPGAGGAPRGGAGGAVRSRAGGAPMRARGGRGGSDAV